MAGAVIEIYAGFPQRHAREDIERVRAVREAIEEQKLNAKVAENLDIEPLKHVRTKAKKPTLESEQRAGRALLTKKGRVFA